jgi:phosphohistidine phosphatase
MKTILLLRHAKSDWSNPGLPDVDRPLAGRGKKDAPRMGKLLLRFKCVPDIIISSPAKRAQMTAELVAETCGYKKTIQYLESLYGGSSREIISILKNLLDTVERSLIISHNPTLEETIRILLTPRANNLEDCIKVRFPTAAMICMEADISHWELLKPGECNLLWMIHPRLVKAIS